VQAERTKAALFASMLSEREPFDYALLAAIANENGMRAGRCSRCGDVWIVRAWRRGGKNRKRCDYCLRNGGNTRVRYIRGRDRRTKDFDLEALLLRGATMEAKR
jgi:hypothetical protein